MKKMLFTLVTMLTIAVSANAMSYEQARREALFLTDKMAYELNLTDAQYEAAYEINLDYLMGVTSYNDVFGTYWERRNLDISYILYSWQWDLFRAATYFYRPLYWEAGVWHFGIYARYPHRDYFYFGRPHFYLTYRGGHSWRHYGGRSYYEGRHDHFRPHRTRDEHVGMRNSWDHGDYRHNNHGRSSTRVTERNDNRSTYGYPRDNNRRENNDRSNVTPRSNNTERNTVTPRNHNTDRPTVTSRNNESVRSSMERNTIGSVNSSTMGTVSRNATGSMSNRGNAGSISRSSSGSVSRSSSGSFSRGSSGSISRGAGSTPSRSQSGSSPRGGRR